MIQEFSIQNYLSFREKQTISFLATKDKHLSEEVTVEVKPGVRLLRMALIYGPNASGKTNLLQGLSAFWWLLAQPQLAEDNEITSYLPHALCPDEPVRMESIFWANDRKYHYELEYNDRIILYEKLEYTTDSGVLSLMYERTAGLPIEFGGTLKMKAKERDLLIANTLSNHTVLSTLNKIKADVPLLNELHRWIKAKVKDAYDYDDGIEIAKEAEKNAELKRLILELLCKADLNITDFRLIDFKMPQHDLDRILKDDILTEQGRQHFLKTSKQLLFTHQTENESFPIFYGLESEGTNAYFRLARLLFELKNSGCVCIEDELDDSLHYDLLIHFLKMYLQTQNNSQLIFTTHNQMLLDEDWMIRRDMVWFAEKGKNGGTILYSAAEMGLHKNVSLLNAYRIGKLGAKPMLGSTLLSSNSNV